MRARASKGEGEQGRGDRDMKQDKGFEEDGCSAAGL